MLGVVEVKGAVVAGPARRADRSAAWLDYSLLALGLLTMVLARHRITGDGRFRFDALSGLLSGDGLSPDRYPLIGPLFAAPLWWLGRVTVGAEPLLRYHNLILFGLGLLALHLLLRDRVDRVLLRRFLLLLVVAGMVPAHIANFYGEMFTAVAVMLGLVVLHRVGSGPVLRALGWAGLVLGAANTPAALPGLGLVLGDHAVRVRRLRYGLAVLAALVVVLAEAWLRRGDPLDQGYTGEHFDFPMALGLLAIVLSFGKGLVFFVPALFLPVRDRLSGLYDADRLDLPAVLRGWRLFVLGLALVYANWWAWSGDLYWGPRFFLVAVFPAALGLAVWLHRPDPRPLVRLGLLAVLALSVWVAAASSVFETTAPPRCYDPIDPQEDYCRFGVVESDLWYPLWHWPALPWFRWAELVFFVVVFVRLAWPLLPALLRAAAAAAPRLRRLAAGWRW
ncbi:hypothetical protein QEZ54_30195 [Catellatospora sp. KI3]|uniref:hypothetical protein n=1 Tax=Catellatospora sp. KI3 TaxID=3041620 RepID=UPI0024829C46|nr:hypothetical protein [Catellatospora sp. KI3]MDI1465247.1 hypothetical protein [Catellatospora sp. KI3]